MKILVVGSGMYVTGRNGTGVGTVIASLAEISRLVPIESVTVVSRNESSGGPVHEATVRVNQKLNTSLKVQFKALGKGSLEALNNLCSKENYDAAIVATPDHLHFEQTQVLLEHQIHCLVVKPLAPTLAEVRELTRIQEKSGCLGVVEFHKRYDEANLLARRILSEEKLGKLLYVNVEYSQKITIPKEVFKDWLDQTNIFQYLAVHYIDIIWFLTGARPSRVSAIGTHGVLQQQGLRAFDSIQAMIEWKGPKVADGDFISNFAMNWIDPTTSSALSDQKYKIIGTHGRLEVDQKYRGIQLTTEQSGIQTLNPYFSDFLYNADGDFSLSGYGYKSISQFVQDTQALMSKVKSVSEISKHRPTFRDSWVSCSVVDAANRSLKNSGQWEEVQNA